MRLRMTGLLLTLGVIMGATLPACTASSSPSAGAAPANPPVEIDVPLAARTVWSGSYGKDIQPIFDQYCVGCHGQARAENGLRLDNYQNTLRGTQYGPVVVPGSTGTSTLASVVQGSADPKIRMPHEGRKLTRNRIQNIMLWIEAGAPQK